MTLQRGWVKFQHSSFIGLVKDEFQITCNTTGVWSVCMLLKNHVTDKNEIANYRVCRVFYFHSDLD